MANSPARVASRNWNLPNLLTYGRVAAVPLVVAFLFWPADAWARWSALAIYAAAAITDFFDGYLARAWSQQSSLGRMLDPIADKLLVAAVLLALDRRPHHRRPVAVGGGRHSLPRDPRLGPARISRRAAGCRCR